MGQSSVNVRLGFGPLHHALTGEPRPIPTERQLLMERVAEQRRKHQPSRRLEQQLRAMTNAELECGAR